MGRKKGDGYGKFGGRKAGTPNKMTKETRELISKFVEARWEDFLAAYDEIKDPEKKCTVMVSLLPFIAPRMASVDYKGNMAVKTYAEELDELSGEKTRA